MVNRIAAVALLFAGGALAAIGAIALVSAPPVAFDSREVLRIS
jgi:hypothetical protein